VQAVRNVEGECGGEWAVEGKVGADVATVFRLRRDKKDM